MSQENQIRKAVREEIKTVLKEDNVLVKFLHGILNNLGSAAKKRALQKLVSTPEIKKLMSKRGPATKKYDAAWDKIVQDLDLDIN